MRRTTCLLLGSGFLRPKSGEKPLNPFTTDGKFSDSFEKVVQGMEERQPFKHGDRTADRPTGSMMMDEAAAGGKVGRPTYGRAFSETAKTPSPHYAGTSADAEEMQAIGDKPPFERVYDPSVLTTSNLEPEYYYAEPPTEAQLARRRAFYTKAAILWLIGASLIITLHMIVPKEAKLIQDGPLSRNVVK